MRTLEVELSEALISALSPITLRALLQRLEPLTSRAVDEISAAERSQAMRHVELCLKIFGAGDSGLLADCRRRLEPPAPSAEEATDHVIVVDGENDVGLARRLALDCARRIGLSHLEAVKAATAVSEVARNIAFYAGRGTVRLIPISSRQGSSALRVVATDEGPGIAPDRLASIFAGRYRSERGLGRGLLAVQRLACAFDVQTAPGGGTRVSFEIHPGGALEPPPASAS